MLNLLASTELISPLCAIARNGCASLHSGRVFVENLWWKSAKPTLNSGDAKSL